MSQEGLEPEILVNVSMRFPQLDRAALGAVLAPVAEAGIAAGGLSFHMTLQPYTPEEDDPS